MSNQLANTPNIPMLEIKNIHCPGTVISLLVSSVRNKGHNPTLNLNQPLFFKVNQSLTIDELVAFRQPFTAKTFFIDIANPITCGETNKV